MSTVADVRLVASRSGRDSEPIQLIPGEEVIITENQQPVAKLVSEPPGPKSALRPPPGPGKGCITILTEDEDHLKDFAEYLP